MRRFDYNGLCLADALSGLAAYDHGATDSGVRDDVMKQAAKDYLKSLGKDALRLQIGKIVRSLFLSDDALEAGYGLADVKEFLGWLQDEMGIDI